MFQQTKKCLQITPNDCISPIFTNVTDDAALPIMVLASRERHCSSRIDKNFEDAQSQKYLHFLMASNLRQSPASLTTLLTLHVPKSNQLFLTILLETYPIVRYYMPPLLLQWQNQLNFVYICTFLVAFGGKVLTESVFSCCFCEGYHDLISVTVFILISGHPNIDYIAGF